MDWLEGVQLISIATALAAAVFWLWSAVVRLPLSEFEMFSGLSTYAQTQAIQGAGAAVAMMDVDRLKSVLAKQSKLSAIAAAFAAASAIAQAVAFAFPIWANHVF